MKDTMRCPEDYEFLALKKLFKKNKIKLDDI